MNYLKRDKVIQHIEHQEPDLDYKFFLSVPIGLLIGNLLTSNVNVQFAISLSLGSAFFMLNLWHSYIYCDMYYQLQEVLDKKYISKEKYELMSNLISKHGFKCIKSYKYDLLSDEEIGSVLEKEQTILDKGYESIIHDNTTLIDADIDVFEDYLVSVVNIHNIKKLYNYAKINKMKRLARECVWFYDNNQSKIYFNDITY